jgi:hypothetical protein
MLTEKMTCPPNSIRREKAVASSLHNRRASSHVPASAFQEIRLPTTRLAEIEIHCVAI